MEPTILIDKLYTLAWIAKEWLRPEFLDDISPTEYTVANSLLDLAKKEWWYPRLTNHYSATYLVGHLLADSNVFEYAEATYLRNQEEPPIVRRQIRIKHDPVIDFLYTSLVAAQNLHFNAAISQEPRRQLLVVDIPTTEVYELPVVAKKGMLFLEEELLKYNTSVDIVPVYRVSTAEMNKLRKSFYYNI